MLGFSDGDNMNAKNGPHPPAPSTALASGVPIMGEGEKNAELAFIVLKK